VRSTSTNHLPVPPENKAVWALVSAKATRKATRSAVSDPLHQGQELAFSSPRLCPTEGNKEPEVQRTCGHTQSHNSSESCGEGPAKELEGRVRGTYEGIKHQMVDRHCQSHLFSKTRAFLCQVVVCIITVVPPLLRAALKALSSVFHTSILQNHAQSSIIRHRYNAFID